MPVVPGTIVGVETASVRSARRTSAVRVNGATVLFAVAGSVVVVEPVAEPPLIGPGGVEAGRVTTMSIDAAAPTPKSPATVHVTVPAAALPEAAAQLVGRAPMRTPAGAV